MLSEQEEASVRSRILSPLPHTESIEPRSWRTAQATAEKRFSPHRVGRANPKCSRRFQPPQGYVRPFAARRAVLSAAAYRYSEAVIGRGTKYKSRSTGKLAASLGVSPAKLDRDGNLDVKVGFSEGRGDVSNAMLANLLEYGKHGQPAKPFLKQTKSSCRKPCIEAMQTALKEELDLS